MKVGAINVVDRAGSPYSKDLHVVERYRLISFEETRRRASAMSRRSVK